MNGLNEQKGLKYITWIQCIASTWCTNNYYPKTTTTPTQHHCCKLAITSKTTQRCKEVSQAGISTNISSLPAQLPNWKQCYKHYVSISICMKNCAVNDQNLAISDKNDMRIAMQNYMVKNLRSVLFKQLYSLNRHVWSPYSNHTKQKVGRNIKLDCLTDGKYKHI